MIELPLSIVLTTWAVWLFFIALLRQQVRQYKEEAALYRKHSSELESTLKWKQQHLERLQRSHDWHADVLGNEVKLAAKLREEIKVLKAQIEQLTGTIQVHNITTFEESVRRLDDGV